MKLSVSFKTSKRQDSFNKSAALLNLRIDFASDFKEN